MVGYYNASYVLHVCVVLPKNVVNCIVFGVDSDFCYSHFINNGFTLFDNGTLFVEFEPTGPDTEDFRNTPYLCRIDRGRTIPCKFYIYAHYI